MKQMDGDTAGTNERRHANLTYRKPKQTFNGAQTTGCQTKKNRKIIII